MWSSDWLLQLSRKLTTVGWRLVIVNRPMFFKTCSLLLQTRCWPILCLGLAGICVIFEYCGRYSAGFRGRPRGPGAGPHQRGPHHGHVLCHMCDMCVPRRHFYRGIFFVDAIGSISLEYYSILWRSNYYRNKIFSEHIQICQNVLLFPFLILHSYNQYRY